MTTQALVPGIDLAALIGARDRYLAALRLAADELESAAEGLAPYLESHQRPQACIDGNHRSGHSLREFQPELDRRFWCFLFEKSGLASMMSTKRRKELHEQLYDERRTKELPTLSLESVRATFGALAADREAIFLESVEELYRMISWDHKTNEPNKLKARAVLRNGLGWRASNFDGRTFSVPFDSRLVDVERVLCILSGMLPPDGVGGVRTGSHEYGEWVAGAYSDDPAPFEFKGHKNGNVHLRIQSQAVVDQCNRLIAKRHPGALAGVGA